MRNRIRNSLFIIALTFVWLKNVKVESFLTEKTIQRPTQPSKRTVTSSFLLQSTDQFVETPPKNETAILWSFYKKLKHDNSPIALLKFLQNNHLVHVVDDSLPEALSRACTLAFRNLATKNDYRTILSLVQTLPQFVNHRPSTIDPRIYSEALLSLHKTSANFNKLKQVWQALNDNTSLLTKPIDAWQTNAMLKVAADRPKLQLEIYRSFPVDEYSITTVVNSLKDTITKEEKLISLPWQYQEAIRLLDEKRVPINNPIVCSYLQLDQQVARKLRRHTTTMLANRLLKELEDQSILPDAMACTNLLANLDSDAAIGLFEKMKADEWYPNPNAHSVASLITSIDPKHVPSVLSQEAEHVNTVVYNAALQSLWKSGSTRLERRSFRAKAKQRFRNAFEWIETMESAGGDCTPDRLSFVTLLKVASTVDSDQDWADLSVIFPSWFAASAPFRLSFCKSVLAHLSDRKLYADSEVYQRIFDVLIKIDDAMLLDFAEELLQNDALAKDCRRAVVLGILNIWADRGTDSTFVLRYMKLVEKEYLSFAKDFVQTLVPVLSKSGSSSAVPVLLLAANGDKEAQTVLSQVHSLRLVFDEKPLETSPDLYIDAIKYSLEVSDTKTAKRIFLLMKEMHISLNEESLATIVRGYAEPALSTTSNIVRDHQTRELAHSQALSSFEVLSRMRDPSASLTSLVARCCASTGLFSEAQDLLRKLHKKSFERESLSSGIDCSTNEMESILPSLHRHILRKCASLGNVTAALSIVEDIQQFSYQYQHGYESLEQNDQSFKASEENLSFWDLSSSSLDPFKDQLGMNFACWKSLITAAAARNYWQVCLSSLQFLQPYVEQTRRTDNDTPAQENAKNNAYAKLSACLTIASKCLEVRSQYAWNVRAIYDWISWSERRPPKESVLAAFRILSKRGRGNEVHGLLQRCMAPKGSGDIVFDRSYALTLSAGAITLLYNEGLYDSADDVFIDAVANFGLPFLLDRQAFGSENRVTLDLHGMNTAVAHSAVRVALQEELSSANTNGLELFDKDLVIVTGKGLGSTLRLRPILRPEVQRMLMEEFYPPLNSLSVPGNMGALRVPAEDITAWIENQRVQKGARMLAVAAALKSYSSGDRLRSALQRVVKE